MFSRAFWGEKNMGFESLSQNMKCSFKSASEFCDFLRDINTVEENYAKSLCKLAKQAAAYSSTGNLKLWWSSLSSFLEKSISLRSNTESERLNIWRDVQKYLEDLQKKQRNLKENESSTQEVVHSFQVTFTTQATFFKSCNKFCETILRLLQLICKKRRNFTTLVTRNTSEFV